MPLGGIHAWISGEGKVLDRADSEQLKQFKRRLERRLGLWERWRLRYKCSKHWLRGALRALWYVFLAAAAASTIYYLVVS
jgi:hypothetical protein